MKQKNRKLKNETNRLHIYTKHKNIEHDYQKQQHKVSSIKTETQNQKHEPKCDLFLTQ